MPKSFDLTATIIAVIEPIAEVPTLAPKHPDLRDPLEPIGVIRPLSEALTALQAHIDKKSPAEIIGVSAIRMTLSVKVLLG